MPVLNTRTARVVDPILTTIAQGYRHNERVGHILFPTVPVPARGGNVIRFGLESFVDYKAIRAPGANTAQIQFGYQGEPFALKQYALDVPVPREFMEDAQTVPGIDLGKRAVNTAMNSLTLSLEIEQATLATDTARYGANNKLALSGADCWNDDASNPIADIEAAKDQVRTTCGVEPNRLVVANAGFKALKQHPKIIERFKYTTAESVTAKMLAGLFDMEELAVGKTTYVTETDATPPVFHEAWDNVAVLAYTPTQDVAMENPSFGYTYTLQGHPFVEKPEWKSEVKSWVYGVTYERVPVMTGIASGFLFTGITGA